MSTWCKWKCFEVIFLTGISLACVYLFASSPWSMCLFHLSYFLVVLHLYIQGKSEAKCVHQAQSSTWIQAQVSEQATPFNNKYVSLQLQPFAQLYTENRQDVVWIQCNNLRNSSSHKCSDSMHPNRKHTTLLHGEWSEIERERKWYREKEPHNKSRG